MGKSRLAAGVFIGPGPSRVMDSNSLISLLIMILRETAAPSEGRKPVIPQIPDGFYYVTVEARTLDKERKPVSLITSIDYRSIRTIDASNVVYVYVTPTVTPTPTQIPAYSEKTANRP